MAFVTFEDYSGNTIEVNPAQVQTVSVFQHYDHDMEVPDKMMIKNGDDHDEIDPKHRAAADKLRTSERVIITYPNGATVVKGTLAEVKDALSDKPSRK